MQKKIEINNDRHEENKIVNSYSQFLTLYHYASQAGKFLIGGLVGAGIALALYKIAETCDSERAINVGAGVGLLTLGFFVKEPVKNFIAMSADYQAAYNEEANRENEARMSVRARGNETNFT